MNGYKFEGNDKEIRFKLQQLSRREMGLKLLHDIRIDVAICKFEGWDYKEYLYYLKNIIDSFLKERNIV